jgi:hypothetical protein
MSLLKPQTKLNFINSKQDKNFFLIPKITAVPQAVLHHAPSTTAT